MWPDPDEMEAMTRDLAAAAAVSVMAAALMALMVIGVAYLLLH